MEVLLSKMVANYVEHYLQNYYNHQMKRPWGSVGL